MEIERAKQAAKTYVIRQHLWQQIERNETPIISRRK